jgi:hypothetical protein
MLKCASLFSQNGTRLPCALRADFHEHEDTVDPALIVDDMTRRPDVARILTLETRCSNRLDSGPGLLEIRRPPRWVILDLHAVYQ